MNISPNSNISIQITNSIERRCHSTNREQAQLHPSPPLQGI